MAGRWVQCRLPYSFRPSMPTGARVKVTGVCPPSGFSVSFLDGQQNGCNMVFHFNPRPALGYVIRNAKYGTWGPEERAGSMPFGAGRPFSLVFERTSDGFSVAVDGVCKPDLAFRQACPSPRPCRFIPHAAPHTGGIPTDSGFLQRCKGPPESWFASAPDFLAYTSGASGFAFAPRAEAVHPPAGAAAAGGGTTGAAGVANAVQPALRARLTGERLCPQLHFLAKEVTGKTNKPFCSQCQSKIAAKTPFFRCQCSIFCEPCHAKHAAGISTYTRQPWWEAVLLETSHLAGPGSNLHKSRTGFKVAEF